MLAVKIPASVKAIGTQALGNTDQLSEISVAEGNTVYDSRYDCNAIIETATNTLISGCQSTTIPKDVKTIDEGAFFYCSSLRSIEIPSSVNTIESEAFYNCSELITVTSFIQEPFQVESNVFSFINKDAILYVPVGTIEAYEQAGGWTFSKITEMGEPIHKESEEIILANNPMQTFCSVNALDFSGIEGLTAYIASGFSPSEQEVVMTRVEKVPAQTGLLLIGEAGKSYEVPFTETDFVYSNLLVGVLQDMEIADGYILDGDLFEAASAGQTIKSGSAYLDIATNNGRALKIRFADKENAIGDVRTSNDAQDTWYTLSGTRLDGRPVQRGVYLSHGRKVLVR